MSLHRFGIDLGSVSVHGALLSVDGRVLWAASQTIKGTPLAAADQLLAAVPPELLERPVRLAVTGGGASLFGARVPQGQQVNELVASARGAAGLEPEARGVVEIGGHSSRWIRLRADGSGEFDDFGISELCAAGAGVFLEQQAGRLRLSLPELAASAAGAERGATVAGRCTVFAKSDMIHLQQKGIPVEEIAYGLSLALARNFQGSVLRGRELVVPVALVGGGAANPGLVRALAEVLGLPGRDLRIPEHAAQAGAVGAALLADGEPTTIGVVRLALGGDSSASRSLQRLPALPEPGTALPPPEPQGEALGDGPLVLGVDVGSVSTNLVLVDDQGQPVDAIYLSTRGRPLVALQEGLALLLERHGSALPICGVATTGSGRHLAARYLGADLVRNEITAQLRSAAQAMPSIDTVLEIGGQDSKFIQARDGHIVDFTMNKVCAAGTGSFLEEQADRLGLSIVGEFADLALAGTSPVDLGSRCTVFMENELAHGLRAGATTQDLCAGLALAVARNYLEKVVAGRAIGERVFFQGGTASNRAVVAAFRQLLGRPVQVHPHNRVSGAIGAALLLLDARAAGELGERTIFRGLDAKPASLERSFECKHCANRCQVTRFKSGGELFFFGDTCERYSAGGARRTGPIKVRNTLAERQTLLLDAAGMRDASNNAEVALPPLGIPRASTSFHLLPVWTAIARAAGRRPVLSAPSSTQLLAAGQRRLQADTCLPIKLVFGHVEDLRQRGVKDILLPAVSGLPRHQPDEPQASTCPFTRHLPWMVDTARAGDLLAPELALDADPQRWLVGDADIGARLGLGREQLQGALERGLEDVRGWQARLRLMGQEVLDQAKDRVLVVMGRDYILGDGFLNLDLGRHIARLGLPILPMDALPLSEVRLERRWDSLIWASNRDYVRAAMLVRRDPRLFPVVLSSFGCGPDGFTVKHLEALLQDRPRLFLELDEHRGEAGFLTRLEAFSDEIDAHIRRRSRPERALSSAARDEPDSIVDPVAVGAKGRLVVPYFADHAYAFVGILRRMGYEVELLQPPGEEARLLGESLASGRECHPFNLMVGDLALAVKQGRLVSGDTFYFPGGLNACLFTQYVDGMRLALAKLGVQDVHFMSPNTMQMREMMGINMGRNLWKALVGVTLLQRATCERRPYERSPGETDRQHQANLLELARAVEEEAMLEMLPQALDRVWAIPRVDGPRRPRIGVAGDIYTRINDFASGGLFARLEVLGCEVWPAPFLVDTADFNMSRLTREAMNELELGRAFAQGVVLAFKELEDWRLRRLLPEWARGYVEPDYEQVLELAGPYVGENASPLVKLNIAKMADFAKGGAAGVLNAICFGCMVGGVSAAVMERIRRDWPGLPMSTLAYGGGDGSDGSARLEAFVYQAKRYHARMQAAGGSPDLADPEDAGPPSLSW